MRGSFLLKGDRVKITIVFRGREITHIEFGARMLEKAMKTIIDLSHGGNESENGRQKPYFHLCSGQVESEGVPPQAGSRTEKGRAAIPLNDNSRKEPPAKIKTRHRRQRQPDIIIINKQRE